MKNILFICKYNRFRSKVAEYYFNKKNKNEKIKASSSGIIRGYIPYKKLEVDIAKKFKIKIEGVPRGVSYSALNKADKIIVIANDIPISIFNNPKFINKVESWSIEDNGTEDGKRVARIITAIIKKVDILLETIKNGDLKWAHKQ